MKINKNDIILIEEINEITIEDFYNIVNTPEIKIKNNGFRKNINNIFTSLSMNKNKNLEYKKINYIWKHKVKKNFYKIKIDNDEVIVTADHSIIVLRNDELKSITPKNIEKDDKLFHQKIGFTTDYEIIHLGEQEKWVYDIEVKDNHNFIANNILVHNSFYFSIEDFIKLIENKMNKKYNDMTHEEKEKLLNKIIEFIDKINEIVDKAIKEIQEKLNVKEPGFMGFKVEKINEKGIWIAKKRYALKTIWNEGTKLINKPKLSVTGLEIVRSSTPDFVIDKLEKALLIMMDKNEKDLQNFVQEVKKDFFEKCEINPEVIAKTSSVNNLDYKQDNKGYYRLNEKGVRIACPINSRAAILHNDLVNKNGLWDIYPLIVEGDKIKYLPLKLPNPISQNVIGFIDEGFLFDLDLIKYIDKDQAFETNFLQPLKLIADAINYKFEKDNNIDLDEWDW